MTKKAKTTIILLTVAAFAMMGGLAFLIVDATGEPDKNVKRKDVDLHKVAELFEKTVKTPEDLPKFREALNDPNEGPYDGEGVIEVEQVEDGTVLGYVDKNKNNRFDAKVSLEVAAKGDPKDMPDEPELVFRLRISEKTQEIVASDRYGGHVTHKVGGEFQESAMYKETTTYHRRYHGGMWIVPMFWPSPYGRGYYGSYSGMRASSVGGRFGSGGVGGGK